MKGKKGKGKDKKRGSRRLTARIVKIQVEREKLSDVLLGFIAPYEGAAQTPERMQSLIRLGTIAWNASLLPEEERGELIAEVVRELAKPTPSVPIDGEALSERDFMMMITELVERKLELWLIRIKLCRTCRIPSGSRKLEFRLMDE